MIPNQKVVVKWNGANRDYYESKGYVYTGGRREFLVDVNDLSHGSHSLVEYICDYCEGKNQINDKDKFKTYKRLIKKGSANKDCCSHSVCITKKIYESYINNLYKNEATMGHKFPNLASEWSEKNEKSPYEYPVSSDERVWWKCNRGHEWSVVISYRTSKNSTCPYCSGDLPCLENCLATQNPEISLEWHPTKNNDLTPYDILKGSSRIVWWLCKNCDYEWKTTVRHRNDGHGCPQCNESKGEKKVRLLLESKLIKYTPQYKFNELIGVGGGVLRFDFAAFDSNGKLICLIEYDGEFHFHKLYEGDCHEKTIEHDKTKSKYCKDNNLPLIRIPYWEFNNIEEILTKELTKYNLIS